MNDFVAAFTNVWAAVWELPVFRLALALMPLALFFSFIRVFCDTFLGRPSQFSFLFADAWEWLKDKIITWMCSTEEGFNLAYKLGWAREGVDFCVCGYCPECPKKATCPYVVPDDVAEGGENHDS